jgi:hypothetical protein
VEILPSSRRHGIDDEDIQHGVEHALVVEEVGEDPLRFLVLGDSWSWGRIEPGTCSSSSSSTDRTDRR